MDNNFEKIEKMLKPFREISKFVEPINILQSQLARQSNEMERAMKPTLGIQNTPLPHDYIVWVF